ncbi:MAG: hypothetical protein HYS60_03060 [Candidatus Wildermuthbacteria bacterium]|nr:hypothetical protein [Candidatus Wildermuthbacteria bacterium]
MKIFEFHFNPKAKPDRFFHSAFTEHKSQKTLSQEHLAQIGELRNALPQNSQFLKKVSGIIQEEYALEGEGRFKRSLQKLGEFLSQETKKGNVDWVGNLSLALASFTKKGDQTKTLCSFTRSGTSKMFVARKGSLVDAGNEVQGLERMGSGTLFPDDKVIFMTQDVFKVFSEENILHDLIFLKEDKQFKELLRTKTKELARVSGILLIVCIEHSLPDPKRKRPLLPKFFREPAPSFSFKNFPAAKKIAILLSLSLLLLAGYFLFQ